MNRFFLLFVAAGALAAPLHATAQTKSVPRSATATPANATDQYVMHEGEVMLRQNGQYKPLSKNVVLADGTKINYKSAIVELPGGKKTTLKEGDYVTIDGSIGFATPGSAAAARGENPASAPAAYDKYVDRNSPPSAADMETRLGSLNSRITLMAQKIQLLNDKISLLSSSTQRPADTSQLDQQIKALDEQLRQAK